MNGNGNKQTTLEAIAEFINGGAWNQTEYSDEGVPVVRVTDIKNETVDLSDCKFLPESSRGKYVRHILRTGDLVICTVGSHPTQPGSVVGRAAVMPDCANGALLNQNAVCIRSSSPEVDQGWLGYLGRSKPFHDYIISCARGSANQVRMAIGLLKEMPVEVPPLPVQRRITGILSAYDELMENCQQRIQILESMARALYREWFVHFRFPGHEKLPRVASPLGDIPQGWEMCTLGDFVQFKSGFAFKSGTFTADGEHRLVTIRNVQDGAFNPESDSRMSELPQNLPSYCVLGDGDILLSLTGNVGRVCLVYDGPFLLNQRVSKLVPVEAFDWALTYCMFREPDMRVKLEQLSNGVAQQNLSPVLASKMEFARLPRELRQRFAALAEPMVRRIVQLYSTIQNLRRTRDLLQPRLLSGQIDVAPEP
jgi:type I restriction enzyme S subunit